MIDPFVLLAPILLLAVLALLRFVGCNQIFGLDPTVLRPPIAFLQFTRLNETLATDGNAGVTTNQFGFDVANGNLMVVWVWYHSSLERVGGVTDTSGNVYVLAVGPTEGQNTLAGVKQEIWYAKNTTGGLASSFAVTATFTQPFIGKKAIAAHEYQGTNQSSPFVHSAENRGDPNSGDANAGPKNAAEGDLIFGAAVFDDKGSPGQGFNLRASQSPEGNITEDRLAVPSDPDMVSATFVNGGATPMQNWIAQMVVFKP